VVEKVFFVEITFFILVNLYQYFWLDNTYFTNIFFENLKIQMPSGNPAPASPPEAPPEVALQHEQRPQGDPASQQAAPGQALQRPGTDFTKLRFGRKLFLDNFFILKFRTNFISKTEVVNFSENCYYLGF
jgi:hypothetical protein